MINDQRLELEHTRETVAVDLFEFSKRQLKQHIARSERQDNAFHL